MSADTIRLPIGCPGCCGWLHAIVGPIDPKAKPAEWVCPYCGKPQRTDFGGPLIRVTKREMPNFAKH